MKTVTVEELHAETGALVAEAKAGEVIFVEYDGVRIAKLTPAIESKPKIRRMPFSDPERLAFIAKLQITDSTIILEEDR